MSTGKKTSLSLAINGFGRVGKLTLWNRLTTRHSDRIIINTWMGVGKSLEVLIQADTDQTVLNIDGITVKILNEARKSEGIATSKERVKQELETTDQFIDPTVFSDHYTGNLSVHHESNTEKSQVPEPFTNFVNQLKFIGYSSIIMFVLSFIICCVMLFISQNKLIATTIFLSIFSLIAFVIKRIMGLLQLVFSIMSKYE